MPFRIDSIARDLRLGMRVLRKHPTVTATSVVSLALPMGACVAAFSLVDALILRPLPVERPGELVALAFPTYTADQAESETFSDPVFVRLREAARGRVDLFAVSTQVIRPMVFDGGGQKEDVRTQFVSGDAFDRLGVKPAYGRLLHLPDDSRTAAPVVVLSHAFWQRRFGGDASAIGRSGSLEGRTFQIAGVAEPGFTGVEAGRPTDVWLPYASYNPRAFGNASFNWFRIMGRMKDGRPPEAARSVLQSAFTSFRRERAATFAGSGTAAERQRRVEAPLYVRAAATGLSPLRRQFERPLWVLTAIAALVLAIAGANAGNLFLARAAAREREMAVRVSIGAGRVRLLQQVLVESAIVAAAACGLGLLFAAAAAPSVVDLLAAADDPVRLDLRVDWRVAGFAVLITLLTTMLFGLAPAVRASRVAPLAALKSGENRIGGRLGVMRPFVVLQVAFGLAVLFVGGLLVHSFASLSSVDPGFTASNIVLLNVEPTRRVEAGAQRRALLALIERLRLLPGVQAASAAEFNLLGRAWTYSAYAPGVPQDEIETTLAPVSDGYFETMRIPLLSGRTFVRGDIEAVPTTAVIVNAAFAKRYSGGAQVVGRILEARFGERDGGPGRHEIVGVVADTRYDLHRSAAPVIYLPLFAAGTIHVRVDGDPAGAAVRLRDAVRAADSLFRVSSTSLQTEIVARTLLRERLLATLAAFFAVVGLALVAIGVYGVLSYAVVHRTREIGIRLALGARPLTVVRTVVASTAAAVCVGAASGLGAGLYLSRFVRSLLFGIAPLDPLSVAVPLVLLVLAASLSALLPALRAARVEPIIALRQE